MKNYTWGSGVLPAGKIGEDEKNGATGKILLDGIEAKVAKMCFEKNGDDYEQKCSHLIKEKYSNCEEFWKFIIVPSTNRINDRNEFGDEAIREREGISEDIKDIAHFHYTIFLNLVYAHEHLNKFGLSSFEDFYIHLSSACDVAEEFLLKVYFLILECEYRKSTIIQKLTKEESLKKNAEKLGCEYIKAYKNFKEKEKRGIIIKKIPPVEDVLGEYFQLKYSEEWKSYKKHAKGIRKYRNVIIHNVQIGRLCDKDDNIFVPKKEKIQNYKTWDSVFAAGSDNQKLEDDFIEMKTQMKSDIEEFEEMLNDLWKKPISDMKKLLYEEKNRELLKKYNIKGPREKTKRETCPAF